MKISRQLVCSAVGVAMTTSWGLCGFAEMHKPTQGQQVASQEDEVSTETLEAVRDSAAQLRTSVDKVGDDLKAIDEGLSEYERSQSMMKEQAEQKQRKQRVRSSTFISSERSAARSSGRRQQSEPPASQKPATLISYENKPKSRGPQADAHR